MFESVFDETPRIRNQNKRSSGILDDLNSGIQSIKREENIPEQIAVLLHQRQVLPSKNNDHSSCRLLRETFERLREFKYRPIPKMY